MAKEGVFMRDNGGKIPILECMPKNLIEYAKKSEIAVTKCKNCNFEDPCKKETLYVAELTGISEGWNGTWKVGELTILTERELDGLKRSGFRFETAEIKIRRDSVHWSNWFPGNDKVLKFLKEHGIDIQNLKEGKIPSFFS